MKSLREVISEAAESGRAVGHFNISNLEMFWAVVNAAKKLSVPVIIGVSEGEREAIGLKQAAVLVASVKNEGQEVFLNADHTYSVERAKETIDAGYDAIILDGAKLNLTENISQTKAVVDYARQSGRDVLIEGELGYIGQSSKVLSALPAGVDVDNLTTPAEAERFVRETGVHLLAPAVGNVHGIITAGEPALKPELVKEIAVAAKVPLVLHGASGNNDEEVKACIKAGVAVVHISTELRVAYKDALKLSLADNPDEVAPYKFTKPATLAVEQVVEKKLRIFNNLV